MTLLMKSLGDVAGNLCKVVLPIKQEYYIGTGKIVAVCTLSSINLLIKISQSSLMRDLAIAGRLLSENRGIDAIINFTLKHPQLKRIIICGKEVKGHRAGQALVALQKNGTTSSGRIIGAAGPSPILKSSTHQVNAFRMQIDISDMIGVVDFAKIADALVT
jgi:tetrahydromethanopterin S-methyltransferase subunit A